MLSRIVFIIKNEQQIEQVKKLRDHLGNHKVTFTIYTASQKDICKMIAFKCKKGMYDKVNTLFITDQESVLKELKSEGNYVAVLLHEENRTQDLSSASYAITDIEEFDLESFRMIYMRLAGVPLMILETKRCSVREVTVEDVDALYEIYKESSITEYMDNLMEDPEEEKAYTRNYIDRVYGFYGYGIWAIVSKESGKVIGRAGIEWREGFDIPEIGFVIAVPYQRQGYAFEVCKAIVDYGTEELGFHQMQALTDKENLASIKLCRKLGFNWKDQVETRGKQYERLVLGEERMHLPLE